MAKALQQLAATSDETIQRYALDWLKRKLEYTGRLRDFIDALNRAMRELERHEIIAGGRIETSTKGKPQAVWTKICEPHRESWRLVGLSYAGTSVVVLSCP
jgi:hypothetical protein